MDDPAGLPPGPMDSPQHQAQLWMERPCDLLETCQARYGDLFTLRLGAFGTIVIVASADGAERVFAMAAEDFECRHFNGSYGYVMGSHALFLQDGEGHRRLKSAMAPWFTPRNLAAHADLVRAVAARVAGAWPEEPALKLRPALHAITLECLFALLLGGREPLGDEMMSWFKADVWKDLRSWKSWTALSRLRPKICARLDDRLNRLRIDGGAEQGLLASLVAVPARDGPPLSNAEIIDQVMMLMITAVDAVAVAASWALYHVAADADVQQRLRSERIAGAGASPAAQAELPYLTATMREVLRLHPVLPTVSGRKLTVTTDFLGYRIPAGVTVAPCQYLIHRRADPFEEPLVFRPERFLGRDYSRRAYFPFGGGGRACLGSALAPMTAKLILSELVGGLRLSPTTESAPATVRHGTLLAPEEELSLNIAHLPRVAALSA